MTDSSIPEHRLDVDSQTINFYRKNAAEVARSARRYEQVASPIAGHAARVFPGGGRVLDVGCGLAQRSGVDGTWQAMRALVARAPAAIAAVQAQFASELPAGFPQRMAAAIFNLQRNEAAGAGLGIWGMRPALKRL